MAGGGSGREAGSTLVDVGLTAAVVPNCSGQREATTDRCVLVSCIGAIWLFSAIAVSAGLAGIHVSLRLGASNRACGRGSSARASANDSVTACCRGETGLVNGAG